MRYGARALWRRWTWLLLTALAGPALAGAQEYTADRAITPPAELAPAVGRALVQPGFQIRKSGSLYCEIWLRSHPPSGPASQEPNVTLPNIPPGTLVGVIRFAAAGADRRGQTVRAGVYTLRYGMMPRNDAHQGAARQRDFLLLSPAAEDRDPTATPKFDALVALSRKASGSAHPAILSIWKSGAESAGFGEQGDSDWVLETRLGDTPVAIVIAGTAGE